MHGISKNNSYLADPTDYSLYKGYMQLAGGLAVGLCGLAAGMAIGIVGTLN